MLRRARSYSEEQLIWFNRAISGTRLLARRCVNAGRLFQACVWVRFASPRVPQFPAVSPACRTSGWATPRYCSFFDGSRVVPDLRSPSRDQSEHRLSDLDLPAFGRAENHYSQPSVKMRPVSAVRHIIGISVRNDSRRSQIGASVTLKFLLGEIPSTASTCAITID